MKSYFLSQKHLSIVIKRFFENKMSELFLWHMHSLMSMFHGRIQVVERENNSIAEVLENLELIHKVLVERKNENFISLAVINLFYKEFAYFKWMTLNEISSWKDVEPCLEYLIGKRVDVDDAKCFYQICNLKQFVKSHLQDKEFIKLPTHKKWCKYFNQSKNITNHSEISRIVQFFFAVTSHNANVESVFSLTQSQ